MTKKKAKPKTKTEGVVDLSQLLPGSPAWIEAVYSSGPARSVEGRSRPTQRDMSVSALNKTSDAVEGRLEKIAVNLLEWLRNLGLVKRFKYQPFTFNERLHGVEASEGGLTALAGSRHDPACRCWNSALLLLTCAGNGAMPWRGRPSCSK